MVPSLLEELLEVGFRQRATILREYLAKVGEFGELLYHLLLTAF
jgi:hypothetical protein